MEIFGVEKDVIYSKGRHKFQVAARSLLCDWAACELGLAATELPKRLRMAQPEVRYTVIRGDLIPKEKSYTLVNLIIWKNLDTLL
jgi:putative transposase